MNMQHRPSRFGLHPPTEPELMRTASWFRSWFGLLLISYKNPFAIKIFRSEMGIKREKMRHLMSGYDYVIHPFSAFRTVYSIYQVVLYLVSIFHNSFEVGFIRPMHYTFSYIIVISILCLLTFADVCVNFFMGYMDKYGEIILEPKKIAKKYLKSYFLVDIFGTIPFFLVFIVFDVMWLRAVLSILVTFKIVRLFTVLHNIEDLQVIFDWKSRRLVIIFTLTITFLMLSHYFICWMMLFYRLLVRFGFRDEGWLENYYGTRTLFREYTMSLFHACDYMLSMSTKKPSKQLEYPVAIIAFLLGKVLFAFMWIMLVSLFLHDHSPKTFYLNRMNQLEAFMKIKNVPEPIRESLINFYKYKYSNVEFDERFINKLLPRSIKHTIARRSVDEVIKSVPLFQCLSPNQLKKVQMHLVFELFSPQSIIVQFGDAATCMYFISRGTVAIYSKSGNEICHMEEGTYFGEYGLLDKLRKRHVTIVAVEFCELLRLSRKHFLKLLISNKAIGDFVKRTAKKRATEFGYNTRKYANLY